jgi:hypothetical protein
MGISTAVVSQIPNCENYDKTKENTGNNSF